MTAKELSGWLFRGLEGCQSEVRRRVVPADVGGSGSCQDSQVRISPGADDTGGPCRLILPGEKVIGTLE
jgi:hypothetical protein